MKDSSDELSTADLAGQSAGSGTADERTVRDGGGDRTGERHDGFPGDRMTDSGYSDDGAYDEDRAGGTGAGGLSGGPGYADDTAMSGGRGDSAAMSGGRGGYAGDEPGSAGGVVDDRAGYPGDTGVAGGSAGYADDAAMGGRGSGVGSRGADGNGFGGNGVAGNEAGPLLASAEAEGFRARWTDVQTGFVDAAAARGRAGRRPDRRADAAPGEDVRGRAPPAGASVGPRRGHPHRRPAHRLPALPLVLRAAALDLTDPHTALPPSIP